MEYIVTCSVPEQTTIYIPPEIYNECFKLKKSMEVFCSKFKVLTDRAQHFSISESNLSQIYKTRLIKGAVAFKALCQTIRNVLKQDLF